MRTRTALMSVALLLASIGMAQAQDPPTKPPAPTTPQVGLFDFGFRGTSNDGDAARYERYGDLRDGATTMFSMRKNTATYRFNALAQNAGYHDQRYQVGFYNAKSNVSFMWDSIPTNYSYVTTTPWTNAGGGSLTLDDNAQKAVEAGTAVGVPTNARQLATGSIYVGLSKPFDMQMRRDAASVDLSYAATEELGLNMGFTSTAKTGTMPWAASFAFSNANNVALPLDQRTNDFTAGMEWANPKGMVRVGYDGSFFNNNLQTLTWDNPLRFTDTNPYNPSGYSNGQGPARGQEALAPSNTLNAIGITGLYKLPSHTVVNGMVRLVQMDQNEALLPWTTNTAINNPEVLAKFPGLASLPRQTAEAKVRGINALLNFNSRPTKLLALAVRYRYNRHDNMTPHFPAEEYVRFDAVPEETGGETEQFDITRDSLDATATWTLGSVAVRTGYGYDSFIRTGRAFADMTDRRFKLSVDTLRTQHLTVRAEYDYTQRRGQGFSEASIEEGGAQPGLRYYDEADTNGHRTSVIFIVSPVDMVDISATIGTSREKYKGEGHEFGLLNADVDDYTFGVTITPTDHVDFGASYGRNTYSTFQKSRNSSPPPSPTWTDPNYDWTLDNDETVNTANVYADVTGLPRDGELRFGYDFNDSDNAFLFGGPRIQTLAAAGQSTPLPNVTNQWNRFTVDYKLYFSDSIGVGLGYWYEKFEITDFATIDTNGPVGFTAATGTPRIDWFGGLVTGYASRPYTGQTGFVRVLVRF